RDFHVTGVQTCALPISTAISGTAGSTVDAVDEVEDVGRAEHVRNDEDHQEQDDDANHACTGRCLIQLLVELRQLGRRQAIDALLDLIASHARDYELDLLFLVIQDRKSTRLNSSHVK